MDEETPAAPVCTCKEKCAAGAVDTSCSVCKTNLSECAGREKAREPEPEPEQPEKKSGSGLLAAVALLVLAGGGAFAYVKFIKPNRSGVKVSADPDEYDFPMRSISTRTSLRRLKRRRSMSKLIIAEKTECGKIYRVGPGCFIQADGFYEGNGLLVSWCVGHLVTPMDAGGYDERFKKWRYDDLPILPEPFRYVLAPGKEDAFENLRALMNRPDVDTIVNACDAGREGELIFRLVYEMAGCRKPVLRLWISSMEDSAIREGFSDLRPGADYEALYQSALCRQKADWLVGINATRLFSVLYHRTLNVGRVQTPTLAMLAERDAKITLFHKEKYHLLRLTLDGTEAVSEKFTDPTEAEQAAVMCKGAAVTCTSVTKEQKKEQPPKLYDLTTLQREANRLFGYTAKQTLDYAQSLYEKKLLTYPRTDSRYLTSDMAETASCVIHLAANVPPFDSCSNFFPLVESMISDKDVSDHHAIIPTMEIEKADIKALPLGERNLFLLVCCKLLCASAEPYVYEAVTVTFDCGGHSFTAKGKRILSEAGGRSTTFSVPP